MNKSVQEIKEYVEEFAKNADFEVEVRKVSAGSPVQTADGILTPYHISFETRHEALDRINGQYSMWDEPWKVVAVDHLKNALFETVELAPGQRPVAAKSIDPGPGHALKGAFNLFRSAKDAVLDKMFSDRQIIRSASNGKVGIATHDADSALTIYASGPQDVKELLNNAEAYLAARESLEDSFKRQLREAMAAKSGVLPAPRGKASGPT